MNVFNICFVKWTTFKP